MLEGMMRILSTYLTTLRSASPSTNIKLHGLPLILDQSWETEGSSTKNEAGKSIFKSLFNVLKNF
jgi:hypothetical protein